MTHPTNPVTGGVKSHARNPPEKGEDKDYGDLDEAHHH